MSLVSVVTPVFDEEENLGEFLPALLQVLAATEHDFEVICVNDGSRDGSLQKLLEARESEPRIKVVDLSRNFGKDIALCAGLDAAAGDAVILMDADLQHPPEAIPALLAGWAEGFHVVTASPRERVGMTRSRQVMTNAFYRVFGLLSNQKLLTQSGDFRLMSRRVVNALRKCRESNPFMKGLYTWIGFSTKDVQYDQKDRAGGRSKWTLRSLLAFAFSGIVSFSNRPLQLSTLAGTVIALSAIGYSIYFIIKTLIYGPDVPGFPSTIVAIMFMGGVQLLSMGLLGEYVGRTFTEAKRRPLYLTQEHYGLDHEPGETALDPPADDAAPQP